VRTAYEQSANSVRTTREQRTNNARTAYEQRANYERELTRELRDAPLCYMLCYMLCCHYTLLHREQQESEEEVLPKPKKTKGVIKERPHSDKPLETSPQVLPSAFVVLITASY
jgi:hypothetical protein